MIPMINKQVIEKKNQYNDQFYMLKKRLKNYFMNHSKMMWCILQTELEPF